MCTHTAFNQKGKTIGCEDQPKMNNFQTRDFLYKFKTPHRPKWDKDLSREYSATKTTLLLLFCSWDQIAMCHLINSKLLIFGGGGWWSAAFEFIFARVTQKIIILIGLFLCRMRVPGAPPERQRTLILETSTLLLLLLLVSASVFRGRYSFSLVWFVLIFNLGTSRTLAESNPNRSFDLHCLQMTNSTF